MTVITLTTDFGTGSPYVAEMKGTILSIAPATSIVDVTHTIAAQDVVEGALALGQVYRAFPSGSIHVAVVDPGVGTDRPILLVSSEGHYFIGPDNGVLTCALGHADDVRRLDQRRFWRAIVSNTFHGRDIMGPAAAHLACGVEPARLGTPHPTAPVRLVPPQVVRNGQTIRGEVVRCDSFGNLLTNISVKDLESVLQIGNESVHVELADQRIPLVTTYAAADAGCLIALVGSSGSLEIAISQGNAQKNLQVHRGEPVTVHWS